MSEIIDKILATSGDEDELNRLLEENPHFRTQKTVKAIRNELKAKTAKYHKEVKKLDKLKEVKLKESEALNYPSTAPIKVRMDWFRKEHPEIFSDVFGKQYGDVANYEDYRENLCIAALMLFAEKVNIGTESLTGLVRVKLWQKYGYPHFFSSLQITEAIENTDLSGEQIIDPMNIHLPYEAFAIVFPKQKSPCWLIHVERDTEGLHLYGRFRDKDAEDAGVFIASEKFKIKDVEFPHNIVADWFFKILYVMASKPEIIQASKKTGTSKKKDITWYSPVIIGKKYQYKSIGSGTTETTKNRRTHWRRGHFRHQQFGSRNNPQFKVIWIEPMIINAHEE